MTQCAAADPVYCATETNTTYMVLGAFLDHKVWVWAPLCEKHAPPDGVRSWPTGVEK